MADTENQRRGLITAPYIVRGADRENHEIGIVDIITQVADLNIYPGLRPGISMVPGNVTTRGNNLFAEEPNLGALFTLINFEALEARAPYTPGREYRFESGLNLMVLEAVDMPTADELERAAVRAEASESAHKEKHAQFFRDLKRYMPPTPESQEPDLTPDPVAPLPPTIARGGKNYGKPSPAFLSI